MGTGQREWEGEFSLNAVLHFLIFKPWEIYLLLKNLKITGQESLSTMGLPWWLSGKESARKSGDSDLIPGLERSPGEGNGNPLQYFCLGNPPDRGGQAGYSPWGRKRVKHDLVTE